MTAHENIPADDAQAVLDDLNEFRQSIDNIDAALIHLLAERFKCTQKVGKLKAEHGLPASDPGREARQIQRLRALAEGAHLDPAFAEKWFNFVVAEVIHHHVKLATPATAPAPAPALAAATPAAAAAPTPASGPTPGDRRATVALPAHTAVAPVHPNPVHSDPAHPNPAPATPAGAARPKPSPTRPSA
ncbi:monofunctional chorismate mutase [Leifsonia psychrotolerans]|uniref:Monofunctional chorismate mutase n=1 Tax=Glaciibacter psychrotolerans TaxID=670054 RepID=A0A7Z0J797_9MICO|nr:monofunctional chorismate mutase [Leifsonia psychrotolerans]